MMLGLLGDNNSDLNYFQEINSFVDFCEQNFLELNVTKTKEMLIDFRSKSIVPDPIIIKKTKIERVDTYKYLGLVIDNRLKFDAHVDSVVKKLNSRIYCLHKLDSFGVRNEILKTFYESIILSSWSYCILGWGGNVTQCDKNRIDVKIRRCNRVIGSEQKSVDLFYHWRLGARYAVVLGDKSHPLHGVLVNFLNESGRMRLPIAETNRHKNSFIPRAIKFHNCSIKR